MHIGHGAIEFRERKSKFVEPFWRKKKPTGVLCCQFHELKWANGCIYDCQYCYLLGTARGTWRRKETIFTNTDVLEQEVEILLRTAEKPTVLHTGEIADSLAVPESEELMAKLTLKFAKQKKHKLLLLTKSDNVDHLLNLEHEKMTVVGFSVNPELIAKKYELLAPPPRRRLVAAEKCIEAGYPVMIRVDPIIPVIGWLEIYKELFEVIDSMALNGVVLGTLRAFPTLMRFLPSELKSMLTDKEIDGRLHLPRKLRLEIYREGFSALKFTNIGVCKETGLIWAELKKEFQDKKFFCNCNCH